MLQSSKENLCLMGFFSLLSLPFSFVLLCGSMAGGAQQKTQGTHPQAVDQEREMRL